MAKGDTKYQPLYQFLRDRPRLAWTASFAEIEAILGFPLPDSPHKHNEWWSSGPNSGHSHAVWVKAGWRTVALNRMDQRVTFAPDDGDDLPVEPDPTRGRRYLIKVNTDLCPADWEHGEFQVGAPRHRYPDPQAGDPVLIWVNDGEETGLMACAQVEAYDEIAHRIRVAKVRALPGERVDGKVLADFADQDELLDEIKSDRTGRLRGISAEMWRHLFDVRAGLNDRAVPGASLRRTVARVDANIGCRVANSGREMTRTCPTRTAPPPKERRAMLLRLWEEQKGLCKLCDGIILTDDETENPLMMMSPDRIDSDKGEYEGGNLQLTHQACNLAKNDGAPHQFEEWLKMVRQH